MMTRLQSNSGCRVLCAVTFVLHNRGKLKVLLHLAHAGVAVDQHDTSSSNLAAAMPAASSHGCGAQLKSHALNAAATTSAPVLKVPSLLVVRTQDDIAYYTAVFMYYQHSLVRQHMSKGGGVHLTCKCHDTAA